ncbi:aspartyl/glutamyl-tRNA(Asn/Gln) amidotransferase subunit C [Ruminococcaceae bacterium KH2T8]|nr:aspartyl/glutamyl-tRNA(Asn/Gln) amidotransferase subunit C [Ruminococcaceae bacterium KH2T8]
MEITSELTDYLQQLGRIRLTPEENEKTMKDLGAILGYIDKLNELDTAGTEPMSHAFGRTNVFREDVVTNDDMRDDILSNAPESKDGAFLVPKTVE